LRALESQKIHALRDSDDENDDIEEWIARASWVEIKSVGY
jgi:hypothetical protein